MKCAIITDSSAYISDELKNKDNLYVIDIPITIDGETYVEGKNLTIDEFYPKMAACAELPKTSQPSLASLDETLSSLEKDGYTHVIGLFLSSGISGFYQNIQYLIEEYPNLEIHFPDSLITSVPLGMMVETAIRLIEEGKDFETIKESVVRQIEGTQAFILVNDLIHLVKGGRLSNSAALLGNLLSIKPILYFTEGRIEVFEKIRTEKKAIKRLISAVGEGIADGDYQVAVIHSNAIDKANALVEKVEEELDVEPIVTPFSALIAVHLGEGAVAIGFIPKK